MPGPITYAAVALAGFATYIGPAFYRDLKVVGLGRSITETTIPNFLDYNKIPDTVHCEDVHHYLPANLLFAACEDRHDTRFNWFPPLDNFQPPAQGTQGSIHVIDPEVCRHRFIVRCKNIRMFWAGRLEGKQRILQRPPSADAYLAPKSYL